MQNVLHGLLSTGNTPSKFTELVQAEKNCSHKPLIAVSFPLS